MPKAEETVLEINLNHLKHNLDSLRAKLENKTKFLAVVKAFAYGSDASEVAKFLENQKIDYFAVAYTQEGVALRDAGVKTPILVLHPQPANFKTIIDRCLEPSLYNAKVLNQFIRTAGELTQNEYPVHIKFNTGLNRLGFWESDVNYVFEKLKDTNAIKAKSIFSHLAASEDFREKEFSLNQIQMFKVIANDLSEKLGYKPMLHICNTSGILNFPDAHLDMVRSGIGIYGFGNSEEYNRLFKPISTLKTIISQIHKIEKNETVGYNRAYRSPGFKKIATLPLGHADGIGRHFGLEKGHVFINGEKAPIVGNVCMDMIMVDITPIDCQEGDEVVIFDHDNTAEALAERANTISYELITSISQRIKRQYITD